MSDDIKLTMTANQLNGSDRVLLDGVISDDECRELQRLSNVSYLKDEVTSFFGQDLFLISFQALKVSPLPRA